MEGPLYIPLIRYLLMDEDDSLLLNHFKSIAKEKNNDVTVFFSPRFNTYIFEYKNGDWAIGRSLGEREGFIYWHSKLGKFVMSRDFNMDNLIAVLDKSEIVKIND